MGAKFLERIQFKAWLPAHLPMSDTLPKSKGVYPKVWARSLCCSPAGDRVFSQAQIGPLCCSRPLLWIPGPRRRSTSWMRQPSRCVDRPDHAAFSLSAKMKRTLLFSSLAAAFTVLAVRFQSIEWVDAQRVRLA